jgi:hypothetical protein
MLQFPSITATQLDALVPPGKADELKVVKFGPREDLYRSGPKGQPIFFTCDECEVETATMLDRQPFYHKQCVILCDDCLLIRLAATSHSMAYLRHALSQVTQSIATQRLHTHTMLILHAV